VPRPQAVAILAADDLFSLEVANGARDWAEKNGLRVVYFQKYPVGVADLSAPLTRIKSLRPDILLGSGHLQESLLIMKQAQTLDVTVGLYAFTVGPTTPDFVTALGPAAEGVFASSQWTPDVKYRGPVFETAAAYARAFERKYGFIPDYHAAESSAAGVVLQLAVEKARSVDPAQAPLGPPREPGAPDRAPERDQRAPAGRHLRAGGRRFLARLGSPQRRQPRAWLPGHARGLRDVLALHPLPSGPVRDPPPHRP